MHIASNLDMYGMYVYRIQFHKIICDDASGIMENKLFPIAVAYWLRLRYVLGYTAMHLD